MTHHDYWEECIAIAAEECGVTLTDEQIKYMAGAVEGGHENIGMAFHVPENPLRSELDQVKRDLKNERDKVLCPDCGGKGWIVEYGPYHSSESQCSKCRGEGRYLP